MEPEIGFCPPECPEFKTISFETDELDKTQMKAQFSLNKPDVLYGSLKNQSVHFQNVGKLVNKICINSNIVFNAYYAYITGPPRQGRQGRIGPSLDFGIP